MAWTIVAALQESRERDGVGWAMRPGAGKQASKQIERITPPMGCLLFMCVSSLRVCDNANAAASLIVLVSVGG